MGWDALGGNLDLNYDFSISRILRGPAKNAKLCIFAVSLHTFNSLLLN